MMARSADCRLAVRLKVFSITRTTSHKRPERTKTLAELEQIAETIKADGKIPFAQSSKDAWIPLMTTNNLWSYYAGPEVTYGFKTGETKWTDPKVVEGVKKHQEWVEKGYFKKASSVLNMRT